MFWFLQEPSSGSQSKCLAKITLMVPLCLSVCVLLVLWRHIPTCCACVVSCARRYCVMRGALPAWLTKHTHNRSEYAAITLAMHISTSTVEPKL